MFTYIADIKLFTSPLVAHVMSLKGKPISSKQVPTISFLYSLNRRLISPTNWLRLKPLRE